MTIQLVKNGVFPITLDKDGNTLEHIPDTGLSIAGTLQGEGKTTGIPSLFIRTSGCNLRCAWEMKDGSVSLCDTPYSSHQVIEYEDWEVDDIIAIVKQNIGNMKHVVISGGEPTRQHKALAELCRKLKTLNLIITVETNGTVFDKKFARYVDLFSISPKLEDSIPTMEKMKKVGIPIESDRALKQAMLRKNLIVLQNYIDECNNAKTDPATKRGRVYPDFQLKFVVTRPENVQEIKEEFLDYLTGWGPEDICLMPVGANLEELEKSMRMTAKIAIENGWSYTPRLQVDLFGNLPGV